MIQFAERSFVLDNQIFYVVIACREQYKWLYVRDPKQTTWELPGGKREPQEDLMQTACRVLKEIGARSYWLQEVYAFRLNETDEQWGLLLYADINDCDHFVKCEHKEIISTEFDVEDWTIDAQEELLRRVKQEIRV